MTVVGCVAAVLSRLCCCCCCDAIVVMDIVVMSRWARAINNVRKLIRSYKVTNNQQRTNNATNATNATNNKQQNHDLKQSFKNQINHQTINPPASSIHPSVEMVRISIQHESTLCWACLTKRRRALIGTRHTTTTTTTTKTNKRKNREEKKPYLSDIHHIGFLSITMQPDHWTLDWRWMR